MIKATDWSLLFFVYNLANQKLFILSLMPRLARPFSTLYAKIFRAILIS